MTAIYRLNLQVNAMLCDSETKVDLLKGTKKCNHRNHERQVDKADFERKIYLKNLMKIWHFSR